MLSEIHLQNILIVDFSYSLMQGEKAIGVLQMMLYIPKFLLLPNHNQLYRIVLVQIKETYLN